MTLAPFHHSLLTISLDQFQQVSTRFGACLRLDKVVLQQLFGCPPIAWIFVQTLFQKVGELGRPARGDSDGV
jgi:hypothetical protein